MKLLLRKPLIISLICMAGCVQEMESVQPQETPQAGQTVNISFEALYPQTDPGSKVILNEATGLQWTGDETATLIFGISGTNNSKNPTIASVSPGVFTGAVTIPDGFTIDNLIGVVVPAANGANFRGNHSDYPVRIRSYIDNPQTSDGTPDMDQCPFFAPLTASDLAVTEDNSYTIGKVQLYSAADLARYSVYGRHPEMESGEILESISITGSNILAGSFEYNLSNGEFGTNGSDKTVTVNSSAGATVADKTSSNGVVLYRNLLLGGSRTVSLVTVKTDKAVYSKTVSQSFSKKNIDGLKVYKIGINLANGYARESLITYSADGGQTWQQTIPETFSTLAVKTGTGVNLSVETLTNIKTAMAKQSSAVDLDLRSSTYETAVFPAVFNGTDAERSTMIKSIKFPNNVTEVAENAFAYCTSLESVDLAGITTINTKAFFFSGLKTLDVPKTVTNIAGFLAFGCCAELNEVYYDSPSTHGDKADGYNHATFAFADVTAGTANTDNYAMDKTKYPEFYPTEPECVITIGPNCAYVARRMFIHNDNIAKIVFQGKPTKIGNYAFNYIRNIHTLDCRMLPTPISSYANDTYQKQLGQSARAAGKELKILVSTGMTDAFKAKYPFKWMVNNGWTIVEEEAVPATLEGVRIGTYNVRIQSSSDGTNNWPTRKSLTIQSIKDIDFDIFGLQEAQKYHHADLQTALGDIYTFDWFCPNKGSSKESIGIAYKTSDWSLATRNTFWINPDDPTVQKAYDYSSSYESYFYRGAIAGILIHKKTGTKIFFMCTHGCLGKTQNEESAFLYPQQEAIYNPDGLPSFFVGDFNARPDWASSVLYRTYWNDTYLAIDESLRQGCEFTFNGWDSPEGRTDRRIDFIYYKGDGVTPTLYKCDNTLYDGKYPSDHWPVFADYTIAPASESGDATTDQQ